MITDNYKSCKGCKYFKNGITLICNNNELWIDEDSFEGDSTITNIALEVASLVEKKNRDYGNSFDKTIAEYGDVAYFLRIEDKLSRLKSLTSKDAEVNESLEDTLKDIIGYTLLMINNRRM